MPGGRMFRRPRSVEYAGRRGIRVHGITISECQHRFVSELIRTRDLPCTVELVNLLEYRPPVAFDGAVFLGTFEHVPEYERVASFLTRHLTHRRYRLTFLQRTAKNLIQHQLRKLHIDWFVVVPVGHRYPLSCPGKFLRLS